MQRRDLLKMAPAVLGALAVPLNSYAAAARTKITDIKVVKIKVVKEIGTYINEFRLPLTPQPVRIGGRTITEVYADNGMVGIADGIDPAMIPLAKTLLVGKDPFDMENHARLLTLQGRWGVQVEIALWDLVGKLANQPLAKLWGGGLDRVMPYGATLGIEGGPAGRARAAAQVKADGFKAVKMRSSFPTMKEDIALMEACRKAVGDDYMLLVDANKAGPYGSAQMSALWDHHRATVTAKAFQDLNTFWLEEPLGRFDYEGLAELNSGLTMNLAGGEANTNLNEFRTYLEMGCYDIINADANVIGPHMHRQVQHLAFAYDKRVTPHASGLMPVICHLHLAASHPQPIHGFLDMAPHLEVQHNPPLQNFREQWSIFENAPDLDKDGYLPVPTEPGLGVTIKPELIDRS